ELASMVRTDLMSFQDLGLTKLTKRRDSLLDRYQSIDHPAAREILAWLQEEYAATTEMVQTQ
ncbi:MAG: hyaluronidase, partial [Hyphomonadaceae bacterium]